MRTGPQHRVRSNSEDPNTPPAHLPRAGGLRPGLRTRWAVVWRTKVVDEGGLEVGGLPQPHQPRCDSYRCPFKTACDVRHRPTGVEQLREFPVILIAPALAGIGRQRGPAGALPRLAVYHSHGTLQRAHYSAVINGRVGRKRLSGAGVQAVGKRLDDSSSGGPVRHVSFLRLQ